MSKQVIVLGAGITGLITAWKIAKTGKKVVVVEKLNQIGGLAGTLDWNGFKYDYGAHNFFTKDLEIVDFYKTLMPEIFIERTRKVKLLIYNKLINFPLLGAQVFLILPPKLMLKAGISFFLARLKALIFGIPKTAYLDEWIQSRFGKVLYEIYFGPYLERVQKKNPRALSSDIGEKKIPVFSIRQYIRRELFKKQHIHPDDLLTYKTYYCIGGYGKFSEFFYEELKRMTNVSFHLGKTVTNITCSGSRVTSINIGGELMDTAHSDIISTLPISEMIQNISEINSSLLDHSMCLEYTSMRFFLLKVKREKVTGYSWVNFNDAAFPYYRVSEETYDEFKMVPEGYCSLTFEIPLNVTDPLWTMPDDELLPIILDSFNRIFALDHYDIIGFRSVYSNYANPRMALGYHAALESIFSYFQGISNLYSIGRQGLFTYVNLDGCTRMALDFSDSYIAGAGKKANAQQLEKYHKIKLEM